VVTDDGADKGFGLDVFDIDRFKLYKGVCEGFGDSVVHALSNAL